MAGNNPSNEPPGRQAPLEIPQVKFDPNNALHRAAVALELERTDPSHEAMFLLAEARSVLDVLTDRSEGALAAIARDVRRRVNDALAALDEQERLDRGLYLALAELQKGDTHEQ